MAVAALAAAGYGGGGDGHLHIAVVLTCCCQILPVRTCYQAKGFCADAHRSTVKAIYQDYCTVRADWMHSLQQTQVNTSPTPHYPFSGLDRGVYFMGYAETKQIN